MSMNEPTSLRPRSEEWCQRAATFLSERGRTQAAADLQTLLERPPKPEVTIVVAGEDKRGKSSLVNSLMARRLSPVGVETVTAAPIVFHYADQPEGAVLYNGETDPTNEDIDTALSLATLQGNPMNEHNVRSVHVGVPAPILHGLNLVDTPGVGGLDSGHAALTLQSLRSADALLFVLEAGAQIRGPELRFLREAAARTARVVFALTKVDLYQGWRQIAEDNKRILSEQAPRFASAPMLPVSSLLAGRAMKIAEADPEEADALRGESGVTELGTVLRRLVESDVETLRAANMVQTGLVSLGPVERGLRERVRALTSPDEAQAALQAEKARLVALNQEKAEWPQALNVALRRLNLDRSDRIQGGLADLRRRYDTRLKDLKREEQEQLPGEFVADLTAFAADTNHWTTDRLVEVVSNLIGDVGSQVSVAETVQSVAGDLLTEQLEATPMSKKLKATDRITLVTSYTSGHAMVALLAGGALGTVVAAPVALAAAIGVGTVMAVGRFNVMRQQNYSAQFRPWMSDQISRVQLNMTNNFQRTQIDVEVATRQLLKTAFAEREKQINESIALCQKAQAQAQGERQAQTQKLTATLGEVTELREAGQKLLAQAAG